MLFQLKLWIAWFLSSEKPVSKRFFERWNSFGNSEEYYAVIRAAEFLDKPQQKTNNSQDHYPAKDELAS